MDIDSSRASRQEEYFPKGGWTDSWVICPPGHFVESAQRIGFFGGARRILDKKSRKQPHAK
jgi:hypothetical protein